MNDTAESEHAENQSQTEAVEGQALAKIEPVKIAASERADAEVAETETHGLGDQRGVPIRRDTHFFEVVTAYENRLRQ